MTTTDQKAFQGLPKHVAIIMDGNGRWAKKRLMPRAEGHRRGVGAVRRAVTAAAKLGISYLTLFAFSSENWKRPQAEVNALMQLFALSLKGEAEHMRENNIRMRIAGDLSAFSDEIRRVIAESEAMTAHCDGMMLTICANYGGRWDIVQSVRNLLAEQPQLAQMPEKITEQALTQHLALDWVPEVDLMIRTGGEQRISNFLLWQAAYAELFCTPVLWPAFEEKDLVQAVRWFAERERRFGMTGEQIQAKQ